MNDKEVKELLKDPKRILNIARVFHQLLHSIDEMEKEQQKPKPSRGIQMAQLGDTVEIVCKDKNGKIKTHKSP